MSDFYGCLESTSFRVRNRKKFLDDPVIKRLEKYALGSDGFFDDKDGYWSFGWYGQYPTPFITDWDDKKDDEVEWNVPATIRQHIKPGDVCQIGVSGNEKLRYIGGSIWWITSRGVATIDGQTEWGDRLREKHLRAFLDDTTAEILNILPKRK